MKPLILITNDDGVAAPGILRLVDYVKDLGDIIIAAPDTAQSGMSSAITSDRPLRITSHEPYNGAQVYSISGTPVDCIKLAMDAIVRSKPDFIFSGINHGSNSGTAVTYSGTMGAVLEGCMLGIPSIGFSLLHHSLKADFSLAAQYIRDIASDVVANGLEAGVCLNVNIPALVTPKGIKVCRAARGYWTDEYKEYSDPSGRPFYWLTGHFVNTEPDATDTDEYWLDREYMSVVPVTPDQSLRTAIAPLSARLDSK